MYWIQQCQHVSKCLFRLLELLQLHNAPNKHRRVSSMLVTQRQACYVTEHSTVPWHSHAAAHTRSGLALNDGKTDPASIKGNLVQKKKYGYYLQTTGTTACRAEHSVSTQYIGDSVARSRHFHVNGHSGCFINIPRTFHRVELFLCSSSRNRAARQRSSVTAEPLVYWLKWSRS